VIDDRNVLVTGADGFVGSHLTEFLIREGYRVRALSLYNAFNNWGWLETIEARDQVEIVSGDVRDPHFCREITAGVDIVFHLAALVSIPYSYEAPDSYVDTNIRGTVNLCQAARTNNVKRLVQTSTSEVYGSALYVPMDEGHPLQPQSPYSASKIGADALAASFWSSFDLPVLIARPFNIYGPRQSARAVIPTIISQLASGASRVRLGDLSTTRDFTFVEDTCRGLLAIAELQEGFGEAFNIGSEQEISVGAIFELIAELMGSDAAVIQDEQRLRPSKSEVRQLQCDGSKLRKAAGFAPRVPLRHGLQKTIEWFRNSENLKRYKSDIYNV